MQKAYSRTNWENYPSEETPVNEDNLNKIDYAVDVIDDRVISLYGYESRAAESATNAKVSETNAKVSETNAKQSELQAKEYMENAFSGTPDGYEQLLENVRLIDIQETTDTTLSNSKSGGYKLVSMSGNSVQKTTTGAQLANFPDATSVERNGVTWSCKDGLVSASGTATEISSTLSSQVSICGYIPIVADTYSVSGGEKNIEVIARIESADGTIKYVVGTNTFKLDGTEKSCAIYCQVSAGVTVNSSVKPMLNKGAGALPWEPYTGGIASPNPSYPQAIHNTGDCVEIVNGYYNKNTGDYATDNTNSICSKRTIPCTSGDIISILLENPQTTINVVYYTNGTYLSCTILKDSVTVPSGATEFTFDIYNTNGVTVDTIGKITLTINGKYVVQFKLPNHQLFDVENMIQSSTSNFNIGQGLPNIPITDITVGENGELSGNASTYIVLYAPHKFETGKTIYAKVGALSRFIVANASGSIIFSSSVHSYTPNDSFDGYLGFALNTSQVASGKLLFVYDETIDTFDIKRESVATVLLNEPLRDGDVIYKKDGLWYVERNKASVIFDGSSDEDWSTAATVTSGVRRLTTKVLTDIKPHNSNALMPNVLSNQFLTQSPNDNYTCNIGITFTQTTLYVYSDIYNTSDVSLWTSYLAENPLEVEYELTTPTIETIDTDSQIAINSLETFDTVTYINVDSRVQPLGIKGQYGTSDVGALALENANLHDNADLTYLKHGVANNLSTTEEGFVLDARMGKILSDKIANLIKTKSYSFVCNTQNHYYSYDFDLDDEIINGTIIGITHMADYRFIISPSIWDDNTGITVVVASGVDELQSGTIVTVFVHYISG